MFVLLFELSALPDMGALSMSRIDELTDRIERLLLRHEELRRTNALLQQQVTVTAQERDSLRARLSAARARIDALIDKLPMVGELTMPDDDQDPPSSATPKP
jgi:cell division protein ZapB